MKFAFYTAPKIIFESGCIDNIKPHIGMFGKKFLIVSRKGFIKSGVLQRVEKQLDELGIEYVCFTDVIGEPSVEHVNDAVKLAIDEKCDTVMSIGGGSLMDVGKAAAAIVTNGGFVKDYLEVVGTGKKVVNDPLPFIAIPTTSGTGSEVTKNSVIGSKTEKFKRSMRDDKMMANVVIMDPSLTIELPPKPTAFSGIDAMAHCLESYTTTKNPTPHTRAIGLAGIELAGKYLKRAYDAPDDIEAREGMAMSSLYGGIALANAGLGAAHGLGMALNIYYPLSHGEAVGITLPYVMEINAQGCKGVYDQVGEVLTGNRYSVKGDGSKAAIDFMKQLNKDIGVPENLKGLGITKEIADKMGVESFGGSMMGNPVQLTAEEWSDLFMKLA